MDKIHILILILTLVLLSLSIYIAAKQSKKEGYDLYGTNSYIAPQNTYSDNMNYIA